MPAELSNATREERVLTLLHLLGAETAELVLQRLDPQLNGHLRNRLKAFTDRLPPVRKQQHVIEEFERFFQFAATNVRPGIRLHSPDDEEPAEPPQDEYRPSGDPLVDLEKMNMYQVSAALNEEQPRTVALLLKAVTPKRVAQLLNLIPEDRRELIVQEMGRDPRTPEMVLRKIASTTVDRAARLSPEPAKKEDPVQRLVDVLRATEKSKRRQMLKVLEEQDAAQAAKVNESLYQFDDLVGLEDHQIQKVLSRIDSSTLSTALFGADKKIMDRIMANLSKRARAALQEELSFQKNIAGPQLGVAREAVVKAIAEADQETEA